MCYFVVFESETENIPNWIFLLLFVVNVRMDPYENNNTRARCMTRTHLLPFRLLQHVQRPDAAGC